MKQFRHFAIAFLLLLSLPCYGSIITRTTFEEYEGDSLPNMGWSKNNDGYSLIMLYREEADSFQIQRHGRLSLQIQDQNDTSYANAYKTFTNSASEYMTEFYMWIWSDKEAPIDSFPLCVLWNVPGFGTTRKTDIALVLDTLYTPPDSYIYAIYVEDALGFHTAVYLDSTCIDTWHKIQIYRKPPDPPLPAKVVLYFDGDSVSAYNPMNSGYVTNKISLGTTQADSLSDGEVFYDDVIITTVPSGEHPRLLFDSLFVDSVLKSRKDDTDSTILAVSYQDM